MGKLDERHTRPSVVSGQRVAGGDAVSGVVHVIRDESEVDRFREGEILVASEIPESWSHLFSLAKAIITTSMARFSACRTAASRIQRCVYPYRRLCVRGNLRMRQVTAKLKTAVLQ